MLRHPYPLGYGGKLLQKEQNSITSIHAPAVVKKSKSSMNEWKEWLFALERRQASETPNKFSNLPSELLAEVVPVRQSRRIKAMAVLAKLKGFSNHEIAEFLNINRAMVRRYIADYTNGGTTLLFNRKQKPLLAENEDLQKAIFGLLHEPPSLHGINRTTWKMADLKSTLHTQGYNVSLQVIRTIIKNAGFRWRSAKVVLTSTDPDYREKLENVQSILSTLKDDERFFSIDEYGPFAIKMKPGRLLVSPDTYPSVPQWQKSKGWLILTAALELSTNQVSHFYSTAKNTAEMIRMAQLLIDEYAGCRKLYFSWDAASWHVSKELKTFISHHNSKCRSNKRPRLELAPLPASAQFLNVIESIFSGMARAIIHNSDYPSVDAAKKAIDRYFAERNQHFRKNPRRAGNKIWKLERTSSVFNPGNNCKNPAYR
jgi:transposase